MEAKFRREGSFGKQRFRGLVRWVNGDGVVVRQVCDGTRSTFRDALSDAGVLLAELRAGDPVVEASHG